MGVGVGVGVAVTEGKGGLHLDMVDTLDLQRLVHLQTKQDLMD